MGEGRREKKKRRDRPIGEKRIEIAARRKIRMRGGKAFAALHARREAGGDLHAAGEIGEAHQMRLCRHPEADDGDAPLAAPLFLPNATHLERLLSFQGEL